MDEVTGSSLYMFGRLVLSLDNKMYAKYAKKNTSKQATNTLRLRETSTLYRSTFIWDWGTISTATFRMFPSEIQ